MTASSMSDHDTLAGLGAVLFMVRPERGHLNPTIPLAERLRARGNDVRYLAFDPVIAEVVAPLGFELETCEVVPPPRRFRPGDMLPEYPAMGQLLPTWEWQLGLRKALLEGLPPVLRTHDRRIAIIDSNQPMFSLVAQELAWPQ